LAQQIRTMYSCGIIMVTGHGDPEDRVLGLEIGADDYVVKPFNFRELLARINSVLRRSHQTVTEIGGPSSSIVRFGEWTFDQSNRSLKGADGDNPQLSAGELDILAVLVENADTAVSRHDLLEKSSHRDWSPTDRSIDVRITRLRKKLEQDPTKPRIIRTVRNIGYILRTGPVDQR
jgi:two-component system OmpR family response regulator